MMPYANGHVSSPIIMPKSTAPIAYVATESPMLSIVASVNDTDALALVTKPPNFIDVYIIRGINGGRLAFENAAATTLFSFKT